MHTVKLNLGCGPKKLAGYLNIDIDLSVGPDLAATHLALPFASNTIDAIEVYHSIEHMFLWDAEAALKEWFRVLKPGGQLVVECPDLRKSIQFVLKDDDFGRYSQLGMWGIYGDPSHKSYFYGHHWGYTPESLTGILLRAGFGNVVSKAPRTHKRERDMRLEARKPLKKIVPFETPKSDHTPRVFWMLHGSRDTASSRIHGYRVHEYLRMKGWVSEILIEPAEAVTDVPLTYKDFEVIKLLGKNDVVIVQKLRGPRTTSILEQLTAKGINTIYIDCDLPLKVQESSMARWTVCSSAFLALEYRKHGFRNIVYIPDAIETTKRPKRTTEKNKLRCAWFGTWTDSREKEIKYVQGLLNSAGTHSQEIELVIISNHTQADIVWDRKTFFEALHSCDFAVLPIKLDDRSNAKSSNRALQAMALGLPVIASPIQAYQEVIHNGFNGFLCSTDEEWLSALQQIKVAQVREQMASNAYHYAREYFDIETIGELWASFLFNVSSDVETEPASSKTWKYKYKLRRLRAKSALRLIRSASNRSLKFQYLQQAIKEWPLDLFLIRLPMSVLYRRLIK